MVEKEFSVVGKLEGKEVWKLSFAWRWLYSRLLRVLTEGAPLEVRWKVRARYCRWS
jgi:hypothetical protein